MLRPGIGLGLSDYVPTPAEPGQRTSVIDWAAAGAKLADVVSKAFAEPIVYTDPDFPEGTAAWGIWGDAADAEAGGGFIADRATVEIAVIDMVDGDGNAITPRAWRTNAPATITRYPGTDQETVWQIVAPVGNDGLFWRLPVDKSVRPTPSGAR